MKIFPQIQFSIYNRIDSLGREWIWRFAKMPILIDRQRKNAAVTESPSRILSKSYV